MPEERTAYEIALSQSYDIILIILIERFLVLEKFVLIIKILLKEEVGLLSDRTEEKRWDLYGGYSQRMVETYNKMVDMVNQDIIPFLVGGITQKSSQPDGWLMTLGNEPKPQACWLIGDNKTFDNDATVWWLFMPDGKMVVSRSRNRDGIWSYDENFGFYHNDDTGHHDIFYFMELFDGLMEIAQKCGFINRSILLLWKNEFNLLYAQYCRAKDTRQYQTGKA